MCGIAGIASFEGAVDPGRIRAMTDALVHRGPDDEGLFCEDGVGLGMRRLAVIDLSNHGHQPMTGEDGNVVLVFNGEIYNFLDLRSRLLAEGHTFTSHTDTEVLVHGYETWGVRGLLERVEGMFAFALLDRREKRVFLARDHFGVKPLYLRRTPRQLSFGSEIRALAQDGGGAPAPDPSFVGSFLRVGFVPSPACAFQGVRKLAPGSFLEVDLRTGNQRETSYYQLRALPPDALATDERGLLEQLERVLNVAVRRQVVSDAPLGVFLSGGLDSSSLTKLATAYRPGRLETFSVGFAGSDRGDEARDAAVTARRFGAANRQIRLDPLSLDLLEPIVASLEEPIGDTAIVPLWQLCRETRRSVTVALSGEGGDEALGGYTRYSWGALAARFEARPPPGAALVKRIADLLPARTRGPLNLVRRAGKLAGTIALAEADRYLGWFDLFTPAERGALSPATSELIDQRVDGLFATARALGLDPVQRLQYVDIHTFLLDNLLLKSDKLSMAHSLEVRVPLLDRGILELGLSLPVSAKVSRGTTKLLLRRLLRRDLPAAAGRPKRGFEIPVDAWFREPKTGQLRESLRNGAMVRSLGFSRAGIDQLLARHAAGADLGRKLFALAILETWARRHIRGVADGA
jgi:asparagine synthase (glutamine-hydrolysing)